MDDWWRNRSDYQIEREQKDYDPFKTPQVDHPTMEKVLSFFVSLVPGVGIARDAMNA